MSRAYLTRMVGDFGDLLTFNLQESDGTASNLTGNSGVRLQARLEGDIPGVDALRVDEAMTVDADPTTGVVTYTVQATDFTMAGLYYVQVEATFAAPAKEITWDIAIVNAQEQHG